MATITSIGTWFQGNASVTSFNELMYTSLISINMAFYGCKSLREIKLPTTLTTLLRDSGNSAYGTFSGCSSLEEIDLSHITSIAGSCFYGCTSLKKVIMPDTPPTNLGGGKAIFPIATQMLYVSSQKVKNTYLADSNWKSYGDSRFVVERKN